MTNNTPDLLPCPFNHKHELERYITGDGTMVSCCSCGIEMHVDQWNTRANMPAEVDLDGLKRVVRGEKEGRYDMDYTYDLGWNAAIRAVQASGHLATGKGGGDKPVIGMIGHVDSNKTALTAAIRMVTEQQKTAEPCGDYDAELHRIVMFHCSDKLSMEECRNLEIDILKEKQPAAPTQIDAGELEAAIDHCESVCNTSIRDFVLVPDEEFWLILKAARAHLEKSKGGV